MKKARVSADEKRVRAVEFLMENKTLFSLKELESKLPKQKGIIQQAVKDLIEELVIDNLIEKDKIGSGNYFWCFPSKAISVRQTKIDALEAQVKDMESKLEELTSRKRKLEETRDDTEERAGILKDLVAESRVAKKLDEELALYAANDPEKIKQVQEWAKVAKDGANRWTDNVHEMLRFFKNRMNDFNEGQFLKHLELPEDFDSVE